MKKGYNFFSPLWGISALLFCLSSCGAYRYYQPTFNPIAFHNSGEVHINGEVSNSGFSVKSSASVGKHLALMGMYNSQITTYRVREGEFGAGFYHSENFFCVSGMAGLGFGKNWGYGDSTYSWKSYEGNFLRPFVQFNMGAASGRIAGPIYGDLIFSLKANYFSYDGVHLDGSFDKIKSRYITLEPAMMFSLGTRPVRFNIYYGMPIRPSFEGLSSHYEARTFPLNMGFGLAILIGVKKEEK